MTPETVRLEHLPLSCVAVVALYRNVRNAAFLRDQLLARNSEFEYALVDASMIVSRQQLLAAVYKAATAHLHGTLRTANAHSEIVDALNPSNNISESYRRFGIASDTKTLVVVKFPSLPPLSTSASSAIDTTATTTTPPPSSTSDSVAAVAAHLAQHIQGDALTVTDENLAPTIDWAKVRKNYKLNGLPWLDKTVDRAKCARAEKLVLGAMAVKGL